MCNNFNINTLNFRKEASKKIAELFPDVVSDGQIDFDILKEYLNEDLVPSDVTEKYRFTWPGKTNAKKIADSPERNTTLKTEKIKSKSWDDTKNVYIEGDNLEVLKLVQKAYDKKIKLIYIDPPYNTGKDFIYKDNFNESYKNYLKQTGQMDQDGNFTTTNRESSGRFHTDWLNMMYPRLRLARNLLTEDGLIFLSIDDNELVNLRKIMDEIFGSHNFVGTLSVENNPKGRKNASFISVSSEYLVIYARDISSSYFIENVPKNASDMTLDENNKYVHNSGKRVLVGENNYNNYVTNITSEKNYSVYYNAKDNKIQLIQENNITDINDNLIQEGYIRYFTFNNNKLVENTYTRTKFLSLFRDGALQFKDDKIFEKNYNDTIRIKSQLTNRKYEAIVDGEKKPFNFDLTTTGAGTYLKNLFNLKESPFSAPKNVGLLKLILTLFDDKDLTVLDFFSGSATTADAVMQQNAKDGGKRKFIMIQLPENLNENLQSAPGNVKKTINEALTYLEMKKLSPFLTDLAEERIKLAGEKIIKENPQCENDLDIGFKIYKLSESNIHEWDTDPNEFEKQLDIFRTPFKEDSTNEQIATELAIKTGIPLDVVPSFNDGIYHYLSEEKELFIVLEDYDEDILNIINKNRNQHMANIIMKELDSGSELKFNIVKILDQNEDLKNHLVLEWI